MVRFKSVISTIILIIISIAVNGQQWPIIYGDTSSTYCEDFFEHYDKGYCFLGSIITSENHFKYGYIFKTDINGNVLWDKKFGDGIEVVTFSDFDETGDHGWIIGGSTSMIDEDWDPMFMKLNACGEIEWCKILHSDGFNYAINVLSLPNGNFLGSLYDYEYEPHGNQCSLVTLNTSGDPLWIKPIINDDSSYTIDFIWDLAFMPDSSIIISSYYTNVGSFPFWIKTDLEGNNLWELMWPQGEGGAVKLLLSNTGIYYSCGYYDFSGRSYGPTIYELTQTGDPLDKFFLISDSLHSGGALDMIFNYDSNIVTYAAYTFQDPMPDWEFDGGIWITDTNGQVLNSTQLIEQKNMPYAFLDNGYESKILAAAMVFGDDNWDVYFWKLNSDLEDDTIYTQVFDYDSLCPYEIVSDTINFNCDGLYADIDEIPIKEDYESSLKISPNPSNDWVAVTLPEIGFPESIEFSVYNLFGQLMAQKLAQSPSQTILLNISGLPSGFYIVTCKDLYNRILKGKFEIIR